LIYGNVSRVYIGRLREGDDLLKSLTRIVRERNIRGGAIQLIGALKRVKLGYFDRASGEYIEVAGEGFYELISGIGNISWRDGSPVIHVHIAASSLDGDIKLGHLLEGCIVDVTVEYTIFEFDINVNRRRDESTGLYLLDV